MLKKLLLLKIVITSFLFITIGCTNAVGVESSESSESNPYQLTVVPRVLSMEEYNPPYFEKMEDPWTFIEFGDWPQSVKEENISISSEEIIINGWTCYKGSDGGFYVKLVASPVTMTNSNGEEVYCKFDNGVTIEQGQTYYFKMEPLRWRVLAYKYGGRKFLHCEKAITNCPYYIYDRIPCSDLYNRVIPGTDITVTNSNYEYSQIRAFLNSYEYLDFNSKINGEYVGNGFIDRAFSKEAQKLIVTMNIDNSHDSLCEYDSVIHPGEHGCNNTNDKIFLLSKSELTNPKYGYVETISDRIYSWQKKTTDYARARGIRWNPDEGDYLYNSQWWSRSPQNIENPIENIYVCCSTFEGQVITTQYWDIKDEKLGVVPALWIK